MAIKVVTIIFIVLLTLSQGALLFLYYIFDRNLLRVIEGYFHTYLAAIGFVSGIIFLSLVVIDVVNSRLVSNKMIDYQAYFTIGLGACWLLAFMLKK